ncbi:MAG: hypothetical protein K1X47_01485 [Cyclobacteriaceae bacterium]|nr:hypothetical protein [Cyclobacteriaceae bacterium]
MRFHYQETSEEEHQEISRALESDQELQFQYQELTSQVRQLDEVALNPGKDAIARILAASRSAVRKDVP